jgi:hypothetical protein
MQTSAEEPEVVITSNFLSLLDSKSIYKMLTVIKSYFILYHSSNYLIVEILIVKLNTFCFIGFLSFFTAKLYNLSKSIECAWRYTPSSVSLKLPTTLPGVRELFTVANLP